jgi:thioredoxin reductase
MEVLFNSNITGIENEFVNLSVKDRPEELKLKNDQVYIFAGGELPTQFLEKAGIKITRKFGETVMKH